MLKDLGALINECREEFHKLSYTGDVLISEELREKLKQALKSEGKSGSSYDIRSFSIFERATSGLEAHYPSSWLWYAACYYPLAEAFRAYKSVFDQVKSSYKEKYDLKSPEIKAIVKQFPSGDESELNEEAKRFLDEVNAQVDIEDRAYLKRFLTDRDWWVRPVAETDTTSGKTMDRGDVYQSAIILAVGVVAANASRLTSLFDLFILDSSIKESLLAIPDTIETFPRICLVPVASSSVGKNIIYYGAPGTGKSTEISRQVVDCNSTRTIFHADTQNSDFVGCLKPRMVGTSIQYVFRPGPFTKAVVDAVNNTQSHYWLVIEEINRASAAAVFGEVFQLLDRDSSGRSKYGVSLADEDMADYIRSKAPAAIVDGKLWLPSNLSLLATMNSSDQAVMPLDTAFKRRWQFEYIALDFDKACSAGELPIVNTSDESAKISWKDFALAVNSVLSENNFPEDRHLGPFFITDGELTEGLKTLTGKLCLYLWDDVLRHGRSELLFSSEIKTYGELVSKANLGKRIFSETLYGKFKSGAVRTIQERDDIVTNVDASLATEEDLAAVAETQAVYGNGMGDD